MTPLRVSEYIWVAWAVTWLIAALWSRRTRARAPSSTEAAHLIPTALGMGLVANGLILRGWFHAPLTLPPAMDWALTGVVAAGMTFAWWARISLGSLWSASVQYKVGHRIVESGPYGIVRHPIYTGLLAAAWAVAVQRMNLQAPLGAALMTLGFWLKARVEERFLAQEMGEGLYADYRRRIPMLIPFLRPHD